MRGNKGCVMMSFWSLFPETDQIKKMDFEHRRQKVADYPTFFIRVGRFALLASVLIILSLGIGVIGYHTAAGLSWLDSLYMASMILTGMGPVVEMTTEAAKLFSSFYALYSGVAFLSVTAVFLAPIIHRLLHILHVESDSEDNFPHP